METTDLPRPSKRRYRVRPLRLAAAGGLLCLLLAVVLLLPRSLGFLLRVPAASPLGAAGEAQFQEVTTLPYSGRCIALRVFPDGTALAAAIDGQGLVVHAAFADGSHLHTRCPVGGEVGPAAFLPSGHLAVWTAERTGSGGGTVHGFGPLTKGTLAQSSLGAAWNCRLDRRGAALLPLPQGVAAIYTSGDGVPAGCAVISDAGKRGETLEFADGIVTAWDVAGVSGLICLGGAEYVEQDVPPLEPFVRTYFANGTRVMGVGAGSSAPLKLGSSATGSHILYATRDRLVMVSNDGVELWSRRVPGYAVRGLHVFPDGRSFLAGPDTGISFDDRGNVVARWRLTGTGQVSRPSPAEATILSLPGGAAAIDSTGKVVARALWDRPSQLIAADPLAKWLVRADGTALTLYRRG